MRPDDATSGAEIKTQGEDPAQAAIAAQERRTLWLLRAAMGGVGLYVALRVARMFSEWAAALILPWYALLVVPALGVAAALTARPDSPLRGSAWVVAGVGLVVALVA